MYSDDFDNLILNIALAKISNVISDLCMAMNKSRFGAVESYWTKFYHH